MRATYDLAERRRVGLGEARELVRRWLLSDHGWLERLHTAWK
jgi:hypothetical protein